MIHILYITQKDLVQMLRDRKIFMFLLLMPIAFTLLFGFAFGGSDSDQQDVRLPVSILNLDNGKISQELEAILASSQVVRIVEEEWASAEAIQDAVTAGDLTAAVIIPSEYGSQAQSGNSPKLLVYTDPTEPAAQSAQNEINIAARRLASSVQTALLITSENPEQFNSVLEDAMTAWAQPPIGVVVRQTGVVEENTTPNPMSSFAHTAPGMMLQFGIAGLLTAAQVLVAERKNRCLPRMLTTSVTKLEILLGHYLAILVLVLGQFVTLIIFGQIFLKVDYFSQPIATILITVSAALCISALGLLIGVFAKTEEQAVAFSLIPMFILSGLGGAWVPLEFTGEVFQAVGHVSPVAWAMDGFKNITVRGLGATTAIVPAAALLVYAFIFILLAAWRFRTIATK